MGRCKALLCIVSLLLEPLPLLPTNFLLFPSVHQTGLVLHLGIMQLGDVEMY